MVISIGNISGGSRQVRNSISFIDRTASVLEIATRMPHMPSQINWLSLLREIPGGSNGKTKLKELKCRRKNIQDAMTWLIKYSPGFEQ